VNEEQAPMVYPGKEKRGQLKASDYPLLAARMRVTARYSGPCAADDLRLADEWEAQARTKQLPSTRTEIGAGGDLRAESYRQGRRRAGTNPGSLVRRTSDLPLRRTLEDRASSACAASAKVLMRMRWVVTSGSIQT
jgi:hypothetical protein